MQGDGESTSCFPGFLSNQPLTDEADGREAILKHPLRGCFNILARGVRKHAP